MRKIATIPSGLNFQGNWNASTNSPTLASGTGTPGFYYNVSVAGSTNLDGETDWQVGDWAVFVEAGATDKWEKIDNTSALTGTGVAGRVAYWDSTNNLTQDSDFTFDGNNLAVGGTMTWSGGGSGESNLAYDRSITSFGDTGTSTITLTIGQQSGNSLSTSFNVPQGTITSVGAGDGLTGGGTSASVTLNAGAGTGITVNADDIAVTPAQTGITSIYNTGLFVGGASGVNSIAFDAGKIAFLASSTDVGHMYSGGFRPSTTNTMALGTSSKKWSSVYATTFLGDLNGTINTATTGVTQSQGNNSTKIATTAYVDSYNSGVQTINEGVGIKKSGTASDVTISVNYDSARY